MKIVSLSPAIDFIFQSLQRINDRIEVWNFAKNHHGHIAVIGSQFCQVSTSGDELEGSQYSLFLLSPCTRVETLFERDNILQ